MEGFLGNLFVAVAFLSAFGSMTLYGLAAWREESKLLEKSADWLWISKGVFTVAASALLVYLIMSQRFEYFYVWNYTSRDLVPLYQFSALWGGQEGSFMVWIFMAFLVGLGLMVWTRKPYKKPVMFVMALTQVFLISMLLGWDIFGLKLGASPFRTIAQEMPNAPFIQANPDFVPADGTGGHHRELDLVVRVHDEDGTLGEAVLALDAAVPHELVLGVRQHREGQVTQVVVALAPGLV
jgi:cytochrome c-type biogenesis protein CcmF